MSKIIYILREVGWAYNDNEPAHYEGLCNIYKKFDTYEAALATKKRLEIEIVRKGEQHFQELSGRNPNCLNAFDEYVKKQLNIDIEAIVANSSIHSDDKWRLSSYLQEMCLKWFLQEDEQILEVLQVLQLDFYAIQSVPETTVFYKIFLPTELIGGLFYSIDFEGAMIPDQHNQAKVFDSYQDAAMELSVWLHYLTFSGDFSALSDTPHLLAAYIKVHSILQYDNQSKILSFVKDYWNYPNGEQVALGLIPLLKPALNCIRPIPVATCEGTHVFRVAYNQDPPPKTLLEDPAPFDWETGDLPF
jgi:hypothetical protein